MIILDTNIWIAYLYTDDSQHEKAQELFKTLDLPIILPDYIAFEVGNVLVAHKHKALADAFFELIRENRDIRIACSREDFFIELCALFRAHTHPGLSFTDVALLTHARVCRVETFDVCLKKAIAKP